MKLRQSLNRGFALVAVAMLVIGGLVYRDQARRIEVDSKAHLATMLMLRESVLRSYFENLRSEMILWSSQPTIVQIMRRISDGSARHGSDAKDEVGKLSMRDFGSANEEAWQSTLNERARVFAEYLEYYDVFFISESGDVLFTATQESDLGTNLVDGPFADSGLGRLFRALREVEDLDQVVFEDFSAYAPSGDEPAAFIGSPVHEGGKRIGFYAVQIPAKPVNSIMHFSAGMGETGEIYLVGRDGLMRSDSRFFDDSSILKTTVSGQTVEAALAGGVGVDVVDDYRGVPVFSAYRPFDFEGARWAVLAEQDVDEVRAPIGELLSWIATGYAVFIVIGLMLRYALVNAVVPASLGAFFGLSILDVVDDD